MPMLTMSRYGRAHAMACKWLYLPIVLISLANNELVEIAVGKYMSMDDACKDLKRACGFAYHQRVKFVISAEPFNGSIAYNGSIFPNDKCVLMYINVPLTHH